jgi:catechol 2,3-dioxygenase-like lactoylglutathione lyase family enzyme
MAQFTGVHHLAFATGDMDGTIRYWRDLLGMRLVAGLGDGKYRHYFFELSETDMVAFFEWPKTEKAMLKDHGVPVAGPFSFDHVSFGVSDYDTLWELKDKIEAAGFWVSEVIDHGFICSIYTFDPNNIPIEFSVEIRNIDLRKHPAIKDRYPSAEAQNGPDMQPGRWPAPTRKTPESERMAFPGEGLILSETADND